MWPHAMSFWNHILNFSTLRISNIFQLFIIPSQGKPWAQEALPWLGLLLSSIALLPGQHHYSAPAYFRDIPAEVVVLLQLHLSLPVDPDINMTSENTRFFRVNDGTFKWLIYNKWSFGGFFATKGYFLLRDLLLNTTTPSVSWGKVWSSRTWQILHGHASILTTPPFCW